MTATRAADAPAAAARRTGDARRRPTRPVLVVAVAALVAAAVVAVCSAAGLRWFTVLTPSMGTSAPVGTLVVTAPARDGLHVGDVIAFTPPGTSRAYTHRVVAVHRDGAVRTRGDLNSAEDPWITPAAAVAGRAIALVPAVGFLVRGLPWVLGGILALHLATARIRRPDLRAALRILGAHLTVGVVIVVLRPFVALTVLAADTTAGAVRASVVSTGLLPIAVTAPDGRVLAHLRDGQSAVVPLTTSGGGRYGASAVLDLAPPEQLLLTAVLLLPAVLVLVVGLPAGRRSAT